MVDAIKKDTRSKASWEEDEFSCGHMKYVIL